MVVLKAIFGAVIGYFVGGIGGFVVAGIVWVMASVFFGMHGEGWNAISNIVVPLCVLVGIAFGFAYPFKAESDRKKAESERKMAESEQQKAAEVAQLQRQRERQQEYRQQMIVLGNQSLDLFESMPKHLGTAEEHLDQADIDFADGAFAPFWDSIEKAAQKLGHFDEGVRHINGNLSRYTKLIEAYEDTAPDFPLARQSVAKLGVGTVTAERMKAIVRDAQRNFQFAMIYEQRKTNEILVAGFTNLAQALDQMTWHITASIGDLTSSVDAMASTVNESMRAIHSRMGDIAQTTTRHHKERSKEALEGAQREKKVLEMLDNIQRKRRPAL